MSYVCVHIRYIQQRSSFYFFFENISDTEKMDTFESFSHHIKILFRQRFWLSNVFMAHDLQFIEALDSLAKIVDHCFINEIESSFMYALK